ncbi:hypothetical protein CK203_081725 [Vitis vinifera]|uniref:F-box/kelch-repeat protein n=1 Tax=Vitis vinifera TaxID=29760 RepID=A0A438EFA4_VITVI|nr:hypothetical protein CK203_081725 [Vitis vinifera]
MGSLTPLSHRPRPAPQNPSTTSRVYASFCPKEASPTTNMSNWIECYNPSNNAWHRVTFIPLRLENHIMKGFSMVSIGASIYIIGGRLCHKVAGREPDDIVEVDREVRFCMHRVRPENLRGRGTVHLGQRQGISAAEVYDPALDEWKPLPNMSTLRYKCVGVTWLGKIHVLGGFAQRKDSNITVPYTLERSSGEVYDSQRAKWHFMVGMWQLDVPPNQIVAVNGKLFSSGDCLNLWKGHIEAYDAKLKIWNVVDGSHLQTLSSPISTSKESWLPIDRLYLTMAPIGTQLYFLAGHRMPGEIPRLMSIVHMFDTSENGYGWRSFESTEEDGEKELCSHCCVVEHVS